MPSDQKPFSPLDKRALAESIERQLLDRKAHPLGEIGQFEGAGIYSIYYSGDFALYAPVARANKRRHDSRPIYVGKAVPKGARKGAEFDEAPGPALYKRLTDHAASIVAASSTLSIADFTCRFLVLDDIWIPLGESLLIQTFQPVWNLVVEGFGNHDPGKGRRAGRRPLWDELHPGREWASNLKPPKLDAEAIRRRVLKHFSAE